MTAALVEFLPMDAAHAARGRVAAQIPSFAAIGLIGYFVDAAITYVGAKYLGLSPELARPPGFIVATIVNFLLNRSITFRHSRAPLIRAFVRYWRRGLGGARGQLRGLFGLRASGAAGRHRGHAGDPAAVRRRRQRRGDGRDLRRLPVLRLSPLRTGHIPRPNALERAMIGARQRHEEDVRCPCRPTTAISTATPPIFSR